MADRRQWALALGRVLRRLRERQGWSQEAFADHCGIHRTFVSLVERGERLPSLEFVERIAEGLGMSASQVVRRVENELLAPTLRRPPRRS